MHAAPDRNRGSLENVVVLLVDDEPAVLSGLKRILHGYCIVHTASDPFEALRMIPGLPNLAVVVSDMRMPGMNGAALLAKAREMSPDTVRILLTGHTDLDAAVSAINDGRIFRFLAKPCPPEILQASLRDAAEQYRLVTAERELLERTLRGAIRALLEALSLANPLAFSRAERIKSRVATLLAKLEAPDAWEIEVAAMLSQLGAITLPEAVTERLHHGDVLQAAAQELVRGVAATSIALLEDVPRLDDVRRMILMQDQRFDGRGRVNTSMARLDIPLGARILRVAVGYDAFEAGGTSARTAVASMREDTGCYDPAILDVLERVVTQGEDELAIEQLPLESLVAGHVLAADILTIDGVLVCGRGQQVTDRLIDRLAHWKVEPGITEPIHVQYLSA